MSYNNGGSHNNEFLIVNGLPYLVAEYIDRAQFPQIDTSEVDHGVFIDTRDPNRSIVNIYVDDIQKDMSTGRLAVIGNSTRLANLIDIFRTRSERTKDRLKVLRKGIVARIFYQLEDSRSGVVLRTMIEDLRINDRNYFVYQNPNNLSDNSLIVNFQDVKMNSINQYTYSRNAMNLRVTNINLFYESVEPELVRSRKPYGYRNDAIHPNDHYGPDADAYYYHQRMQNEINLCDWQLDHSRIPPNNGYRMFDRFYHYDEEYNCFRIHFEDVYDRSNSIVPIACGKIKVNKTFRVNPGSIIVFNLSIFKNDIIFSSDNREIADAMKIPIYRPLNANDRYPNVSLTSDPVMEYHPAPPPHHNTRNDYLQNRVINQLATIVMQMSAKIEELSAKINSNPVPSNDGNNNEESNNNDDGDSSLVAQIQNLQNQIQMIQDLIQLMTQDRQEISQSQVSPEITQ